MFVTQFKSMLASLPTQDVGYEEFMRRLRGEESVAEEFFIRVTNFAASHAPGSVHYDPQLLTTAFFATRFPLEVLGEPEEPTRFTLFNSAWKYLRVVDVVLYTHNPAEDDSAIDFLDPGTCMDYMLALNELHNAWNALSSGLPCSVVY